MNHNPALVQEVESWIAEFLHDKNAKLKTDYRWRLKRFARFMGFRKAEPARAIAHFMTLDEASAKDTLNAFVPWLRRRGRAGSGGMRRFMMFIYERGGITWKPVQVTVDQAQAEWTQCSPAFRARVDKWLEPFSQHEYSRWTLRGWAIALRRLGQFLHARSLNFLRIEYAHASGWVKTQRSDGASEASIYARLAIAKRFYSWLRWKGMVAENPFRGVEPPRLGKYLPKALSPATVRALIQATKNIRDRAIIELMYATAGSTKDLSALNFEHVSLTDGWVRYKEGRQLAREVPINDHAQRALRRYLEPRLLHPHARPVQEAPVFLSCLGTRLSPAGIQIVLERISQNAGMNGLSAKLLRNSFSTHFLDRGGDPVVLKYILGQHTFGAIEKLQKLSTTQLRKVYDRTHPRA